MMRALIILVALLVLGCGSNLDGSATFTNGTLSGNATVQTPLGTFTLGPPRPGAGPSPSPSP